MIQNDNIAWWADKDLTGDDHFQFYGIVLLWNNFKD
jgi:hypothetical protein